MLQVKNLHKSYAVGKQHYEVLKGVSLSVEKMCIRDSNRPQQPAGNAGCKLLVCTVNICVGIGGTIALTDRKAKIIPRICLEQQLSQCLWMACIISNPGVFVRHPLEIICTVPAENFSDH